MKTIGITIGIVAFVTLLLIWRESRRAAAYLKRLNETGDAYLAAREAVFVALLEDLGVEDPR